MTTLMILAVETGRKCGRSLANHVLANNEIGRDWTGLEIEDGDRLLAVGIDNTMPEFAAAEAAARDEYEMILYGIPAEDAESTDA